MLTKLNIRIGQAIILVIWILIPLAIAIAGFANYWIGLSLFIYSIFQIIVQGIKFFGKPDKWIPGYKKWSEKDRKMRHYYYHCERNPEGFQKILNENLNKE